MRGSRQLRLAVSASALVSALALSLLLTAPASAAFPGDDGRVVFRRDKGGQYDLFSVRANGGDLRRLTKTPVSETSPAFSPNGERLAFVRSGDIFTMSAAGGNTRRLTRTQVFEAGPTYSPTGRRIAFSREVPGFAENLFTMRARDGRKRTRITQIATGDEAVGPSWSTQGIAFAYVDNFPTRTASLYLVKGDGTGLTPLTTPPPGTNDASPDWSPDATEIAFESDRAGGFDIHKITVPGGVITNLTLSEPPTQEFEPAWSPSGVRIAYVEDFADNIYTIDSDGTDQLEPLVTGPAFDFEPTWQPR